MFAGILLNIMYLIRIKIKFISLRDAKNMARDVHDILVDICEKEGGMGRTQAIQYVKDLGQKSRYVLDVWS